MTRERAASAVAATFFLLPFVALRTLDAPAVPAALVFVLVATTLWRPAVGLCALMLGLPLSIVVERVVGFQPTAAAIVDMLVLAFAAAGALGLAGRRVAAPSRRGAPAAVLAVVIATSTIGEWRAWQAITPARPVFPDIWQFIVSDYWTTVRGFDAVRVMFRWLAWLATAVWAERILMEGPARVAILRVWLASGLVGAALAIHQVVEVALTRAAPFWSSLAEFWTSRRLSVLQPDVNAAGSRLLLFIVPVVAVGTRLRRFWLLAGALPLLVAAFGLSRSRAAIAAGVVALCGAAVWRMWRPSRATNAPARRRAWLAAGAVALGAFVVGGTLVATGRSHARVGDALQIRLDLLHVGLQAVARHPVFGVGLADYIRSTRRFVTDDMVLVRRMSDTGENSHNNFLQIAVEIGVPGCLIFIWMMWRAVVGGGAGDDRGSAWSAGAALGVVAFLGSALFGHPLLLPVVGATFFVTVGIAAGLKGAPGPPLPWLVPLCWMTAGLYIGSLVWRW